MIKIEVSVTLLEQLYNKKQKERFLKEKVHDNGTRTSYAIYLMKVAKIEKSLKKDFSNFNKEEILQTFKSLNIESITSLRTLYSILKSYNEWIYLKTNLLNNPFIKINFKRDIFPIISIEALSNKYLTEDQIWEVVEKSNNYQDSICLLLPFYSVKGNKDIELINLKKQDIDYENNQIEVLVDKKSKLTRTVALPEKIIYLIDNASRETEYQSFRQQHQIFIPLTKSDYIIKPVDIGNRNSSTKQIAHGAINLRAKNLLINAGYPNTSINDITISGKLHMLKQIETNKKKLEISDYKFVNKQFGDNIENYNNVKTIYELLYKRHDKQTSKNKVLKKEKLLKKELDKKTKLERFFELKCAYITNHYNTDSKKTIDNEKVDDIKKDMLKLLNKLNKEELKEIIIRSL